MDNNARKNLGEIFGEFLRVERQMTLVERSGRNFITEFLQNHEPVQFKPVPYWEERIKAGIDDAYEEALMEDSEHVVFDRLSEKDPTDGNGYLVSISWDKEVEDIVADVYVTAEKKEQKVHLGNIKTIVEVLRFIDAFA